MKRNIQNGFLSLIYVVNTTAYISSLNTISSKKKQIATLVILQHEQRALINTSFSIQCKLYRQLKFFGSISRNLFPILYKIDATEYDYNFSAHTVGTDAPLTIISSANLTLDGFFFSLSFFAAVSNADFLDDCNTTIQCS